MNVTASSPTKQRFACRHDSTRIDGTLDNICLLCGLDGYWKAGQRLDQAHPSGKVLFALPTKGPGRLRRALRGLRAFLTVFAPTLLIGLGMGLLMGIFDGWRGWLVAAAVMCLSYGGAMAFTRQHEVNHHKEARP